MIRMDNQWTSTFANTYAAYASTSMEERINTTIDIHQLHDYYWVVDILSKYAAGTVGYVSTENV